MGHYGLSPRSRTTKLAIIFAVSLFGAHATPLGSSSVALAADPCPNPTFPEHCYSKAHEFSEGTYTGVRDLSVNYQFPPRVDIIPPIDFVCVMADCGAGLSEKLATYPKLFVTPSTYIVPTSSQ